MSLIRSIFITGPHRSGTTILNMILGCNSECIAVGEVNNVIKPGQNRRWIEDHFLRCTCGQCEFWPEVIKAIDRKDSDDLETRYSIFIAVFSEHFPGKIPVDSSKNIAPLHALQRVTNCSTVRIIRDVRAWSVSQSGTICARNMLRWYKLNRYFQKSAPGAIKVGYEPLVLDPEKTVSKLCGQLALHFEPSMLAIDNTENHILVGNRMRTNESLTIQYDGRWMRHNSIWPIILSPIMHYNIREVYLQRD